MDAKTARMADANLNRACEGLRLLEDVARFISEDGSVSRRCKDVRHAVRAAGVGLIGPWAAASRNADADVGRSVKATDEGSRRSMREAVAAAARRAAEALRVLEEVAKTCGGGWEGFESARYTVYDLETSVSAALPARPPARWRLCVLITAAACRRPWAEVAAEAIEGGADCLQLREKDLGGRALLERARRLMEIARGRAAVIINDRPDVALASGADGVHVGQEDVPAREARRVVGDALCVGVSTSRLEEARRAADDGADYVGLGPMYASATKAKPELAGPEYLRAFLADPVATRLGHVAISGIDAGRTAELAGMGCLGVAVSAAVCGAEDPRAAAAAIVRAMAAPAVP